MNRTAGEVYPVLPLRDIVVFPHMIVPLFVGRERSVKALEDVMKEDKQILLIAQKNAADDETCNQLLERVGPRYRRIHSRKEPATRLCY